MRKMFSAGGLAVLTALLAACGGGGDDGNAGGGDGGATTRFITLPAGSVPRIEAYDLPGARALGTLKNEMAFTPRARPVVVALGAPVLSPAASVVAVPQPGTPRQIGQNRELAATADVSATHRLLSWQALAGGAQVAAASFHSEGAAGLRLALRVEKLPAQALLRVYVPGSGKAVAVTGQQVMDSLAHDARDGSGSGLYWLPGVDGDTAALEIELPAGADPSAVAVSVPRLSHRWISVAQMAAGTLKAAGDSGSCNVNAICSAEYADDSRAVAMITFDRPEGAFTCTGTLMADTAASRTPYFLTANHCITNQAAASTVVTHWFYWAAACGTLGAPQATVQQGGATLLHASAATDTAFLQLRQAPPAGVRFAGSLLGPVAVGVGLAGLHHASADVLKLSLGELNSYVRCDAGSCLHSNTTGNGEFFTVRWSSGTTESGSSGSAAFATMGGKHYVVGQLYAGSASCTSPRLLDYYGRFDLAYSSALRNWLGAGIR